MIPLGEGPNLNVLSFSPLRVLAPVRGLVLAVASLPLMLSSSVLIAAENSSCARFSRVEAHMGTKVTVVLYTDDAATAELAFRRAFDRIVELNAILSHYEPQSELTLLSESSPHAVPIAVTDELWQVLFRARQLSELSEGAFDVTIGPLTKLWRRTRRKKKLPDRDRFQRALTAVGFENMLLDSEGQTVQLTQPDMRLDLGGIAKGFIADEALRSIQELGIHRALVETGGDLAVGEAPPEQRGWLIGIAGLERNQTPDRFITVSHCGVATSGDLWQFVEIAGQRYSHILDPRTGLGLMQRSSVTIVAQNCLDADGLASCLSVLGAVAGEKLIAQQPGAEMLMLTHVDDHIQEVQSSGFPKLSSR
jgi:thiamine biosynthesis lipoprotein